MGESAAQATTTDAELLARYADGDQAAARALVERHTPRILARAYRLLGDAAEAEDETQEAMLRLWRIAPVWENRGASPGTWLYRVATNLCLDLLRKRRYTRVPQDPAQPEESETVQASLQDTDRSAALKQAIAALPDRQRAAIVLRHLEELGNTEIAEQLDTTVEAVESLLARGRRQLVRLSLIHI